jgi:type I restriction enzyme S subunit
VKATVDPETSGLERYVAGEHMDTDDLHIRRWGTVGDGYLGPAFHRRFSAGQVLYGSRRTYLRKVAVAEFDGICANTTFVLEARGDQLVPDLLPFIMQTDAFTEHSVKNSKGSVNPYINWGDIACYEFPLPPLDEQRRIAEILWAAEEAVVRYRKVLEGTGDLLLSFRAELFGERDSSKFRLADLCVPDGIQIGPFGSQLHASDYVADTCGVPVIMPCDMSEDHVLEGSIARISPEMAAKLSRHKVLPGDILLPRRGELGRRAFIRPEQSGWICGTGSIRIRLQDSVPARAVFHALSAPQTVSWIESNSVGTTMSNLNSKIVSNIPVMLPKEAKLSRIAEALDSLQDSLQTTQRHINSLGSLKNSLTNALVMR